MQRAQQWTVVLDVGANVGQFAREIRDAGHSGEIHSFEPSSDSFTALQAVSKGDPAWFVHKCALGAAPGQATMHRFPGSDWNSLHERAADRRGSRFDGVREWAAEVVEVRTLPSVAPRVAGPWLLKTDTQGHDLEVVRGGLADLPQVSAVLMELSAIPLYKAQPPLHEAIEFLDGLGFTPMGFFPVSRRSDHLAVIEFDGLFVRTRNPLANVTRGADQDC